MKDMAIGSLVVLVFTLFLICMVSLFKEEPQKGQKPEDRVDLQEMIHFME